METLAKALVFAIPAAAAAIGIGLLASSALSAAGRNPEKIGNLQTMMIVGAAFVDALAIFGLLAFFII